MDLMVLKYRFDQKMDQKINDDTQKRQKKRWKSTIWWKKVMSEIYLLSA